MKNQKGILASTAAIIILVVIVLVLGGYFTYEYYSKVKSQENISQLLGGDKDEHGCIGSAGYSWCEAKQKCLREWEEKCQEQKEFIAWPNVNSFDLDAKTFSAKGVGKDASMGVVNIKTNNSTKYYMLVRSIPNGAEGVDYKDFEWVYSTMKNWVGPEWWFTIKGAAQADGSVMASEIFQQIQ